MWKRTLIVMALCAASLGVRVSPVLADDLLPPKVLIKVLMTVLTYDKNLHKHRSPVIRIGVVSPTGSPAGKSRAASTLAAFQSFAGKKVKGLPFEVEALPVNSDADVALALSRGRYNILFLCRDSVRDAAAVGKLASDKKVLTLTGFDEFIRDGLSIGAVLRGGKPKIMINLTASKAQGASLDARLLNLADVVR